MKNCFVVVLILSLITSCKNENETNWTIDTESQYKIPYGTHVLRNQLVDLTYHANEVQDIKETTQDFIKEKLVEIVSGSCFIHINTNNFIDKKLWEDLDKYTQNKNQVFIAEHHFSNPISLYFEDSTVQELINAEDSSLMDLPFGNLTAKTFTPKNKLLTTQLFFGDTLIKTYRIKTRNDIHGYFTKIPKDAEVIGTVLIGDSFYPNFIRTGYYSGFLLHADPLLFTNYYMLKDSSYKYVAGCLSYLLQAKPVYWDGYRTLSRYTNNYSEGGIKDLLKFIFNNKGLKWGFFILFFGVLIHLITNSQRILGILPFHKKEHNHSIQFVDMITALFNKEKNYNKLALHKANYFFDKIKNEFNISPNLPTELLADKLHEKTKIDTITLTNLIHHISLLRQDKLFSQKQFIDFSQLLNSFIIKTKKHE